MQESKDYWVNQFKDDVPVLNMPTDYARPAIQSFEGAKVYKTVSSTLTEKINSLAKKLDVSNYMLLLACYYVLLSKYTGQEDIVVGTPVVGRNKEELLNMIGMFVNSLPLKNNIESSMSFNDFLKTVKENSIEALSHQVYPFDELVNTLNLTRDNSRNPLFDTMFTYQNNGLTPVHFNGINSKYYIPDTKISKFDTVCYSLVTSGIVGNLIDRLFYGKVIDYIDFHIFGYDAPVFNFADMCIVIGALMIIYILIVKGDSDENIYSRKRIK